METIIKDWPLVLMSIGLITGAIIDGWKFKVPNWLTFPLIISGWLLGLLYTFTDPPYAADLSNRLFSSLWGTILACGLLLPVYAIGGMGAGDVKLLMGFGAWMGAYFGAHHGGWMIFYSFCCGVIIGGIIGLMMMIPRFAMHMQTAREIVKDIATSKGNVAEIAKKSEERKPRWVRLPYGVPLTIGFVGYVWLREFACLPEFLNPYPP
jgi:prepilin peptidase CpaA